MSCNSAYSSLFVVCDTAEQRDELLIRFRSENDNPVYKEFVAYRLSDLVPLCIDIDFMSNEVSSNLDNHILELDRWLYESFGLRLKGYWLLERSDNSNFRCEIADGKIFSAYLDWLCNYTVDQIHDIYRYATETYR